MAHAVTQTEITASQRTGNRKQTVKDRILSPVLERLHFPAQYSFPDLLSPGLRRMDADRPPSTCLSKTAIALQNCRIQAFGRLGLLLRELHLRLAGRKHREALLLDGMSEPRRGHGVTG